MFFSWYKNNKSFKKGHDIKAQVVPLLMVVMVVLLIAALATINIGRVALDKTYSANSADAGALASATSYASGFNGLSTSNAKLWKLYQKSRVAIYQTKEEADNIIDIAIAYAVTGLALGTTGYYLIQYNVQICPFPYTLVWQYAVAAALFALAGAAFTLSQEKVGEFITVCNYLRGLVDAHHKYGNALYKIICGAMETAQSASATAGKSYGFSNSGISSKLSVAQSDAFTNWMDSGGSSSGVYSWNDKSTTLRTSMTHKVTVSVDVPVINSYDIKKTNYTYSKECDIIDDMISTANIISTILGAEALASGLASAAITYYLAGPSISGYLAFLTYTACNAACAGPQVAACLAACFAAYAAVAFPLCAKEQAAWPWAVGYTFSIITTLAGLLVVGGAITFYFLKDNIEDAYYGFMMDGTYSSSGCSDTDDILIVKITAVYPAGWETQCCSQQDHPATSQGLIPTKYQPVNSCARATFDKAGIGSSGPENFTTGYDSELTSAS